MSSLMAIVIVVMEICFQLLKKKIPDTLASIRHLCLFLKDTTWKHTTYHINNSNAGHTRLKQQLEKNLKLTFASSPKNAVEKNKEKKIVAIAKIFALHVNEKRDFNTRAFLWVLRSFKNTYFEEHLWTNASEELLRSFKDIYFEEHLWTNASEELISKQILIRRVKNLL